MPLYTSGSMPSRFVVYGSSGFCVQCAMDFRLMADGQLEHLGYIDDVRNGHRVPGEDRPVWSFEQLREMDDVGVLVPFFDSEGRRRAFERLRAAGIPIIGTRGAPHLTYPWAKFGEGVIVSSTTRVGPGVRIGDGAIAISDMIGHDVEIGDFATLAWQSVVLGHVSIGAGVFVGAGAVIQNGWTDRRLTIGAGAVIGAGAMVDRNVEPGEVFVSPRAMPLRQWASLRGAAARGDAVD